MPRGNSLEVIDLEDLEVASLIEEAELTGGELAESLKVTQLQR